MPSMMFDDFNDKYLWCQGGRKLEDKFVAERRFNDVQVRMNPAKEQDIFTYDMRIDMPCDLKTLTTPWIYSERMFGIPPTYAVSINRKDLRRYYQLYPNIIIILDVQYPDYQGTHWTDMTSLERMVRSGKVHLHKYQTRVDDTQGNAKDSYIFDVRWFPKLAQ